MSCALRAMVKVCSCGEKFAFCMDHRVTMVCRCLMVIKSQLTYMVGSNFTYVVVTLSDGSKVIGSTLFRCPRRWKPARKSETSRLLRWRPYPGWGEWRENGSDNWWFKIAYLERSLGSLFIWGKSTWQRLIWSALEVICFIHCYSEALPLMDGKS